MIVSMESLPIQIIYLNGPSSSGKTTLAKAIQKHFSSPFLHLGIDKIIGWMPEKINDWTGGPAPLGYSWKPSRDAEGHLIHELQIGPYAQKMEVAFREVVLTLVRLGHSLILDDVCLQKKHWDAWKEALKGLPVLWVGVKAPLAILEEREKLRGDRILGSARDQFYKVHNEKVYDLEIDTSLFSPLEQVLLIQKRLLQENKKDSPSNR